MYHQYMPPIRKENLLPEDSFIHYCQRDELDGQKLHARVTPAFLRAAEKDALIVPLHVEKQKLKQGEIEEEIDVRFYSPFQIYLVAGLIENDIDEDGYLRDPENKDWQKQQNTRYIKWGGWSAFNADIYQKKRGEEPDHLGNHFTVADEFHRTLRLIHGLEEEERFKIPRDKSRLLTGQPTLVYNLEPVRTGGEAYLQQYDLDAKKLKRVIANVGYLASHIDPLERWFYYIRRHPQFRRDQLKGTAAISQDLYGFCDIAYDLMEIAFGEKLPQLPDLLHPDHKPYLMERAEYASGEDIKAIGAAFANLRKWVNDNADLIDELRPTIEQEKLDGALSKLEARIADYEKRYGDRRYVGSIRRFKPETLKLTDLDEETKFWAQNMLEQRLTHEEERGKVSDSGKELMLKHEISFAIERGLDGLGRAVADVAYKIAEATWPIHYKAEREKEMSHMPALQEFAKKVPATDPDYARKNAEFWSKGMKEFEKPFQDKMDRVNRARKELHGIGGQTRLVLCAACRKNPVQRHYAHVDQQITQEAVCDACLESEKKKAMSGSAEDRKKMKYAEWHCDYCGAKVLLKFAVGNTISVTTLNQVPIQVTLKYGQMELQAQCPDCKETSERPVDWGWLA